MKGGFPSTVAHAPPARQPSPRLTPWQIPAGFGLEEAGAYFPAMHILKEGRV